MSQNDCAHGWMWFELFLRTSSKTLMLQRTRPLQFLDQLHSLWHESSICSTAVAPCHVAAINQTVDMLVDLWKCVDVPLPPADAEFDVLEMVISTMPVFLTCLSTWFRWNCMKVVIDRLLQITCSSMLRNSHYYNNSYLFQQHNCRWKLNMCNITGFKMRHFWYQLVQFLGFFIILYW